MALSRLPGMTVAKAASDLSVPANTQHRWRNEPTETGETAFRGNGNRTTEQEELDRLRRENAELRMEREFLEKAAVGFAKHVL